MSGTGWISFIWCAWGQECFRVQIFVSLGSFAYESQVHMWNSFVLYTPCAHSLKIVLYNTFNNFVCEMKFVYTEQSETKCVAISVSHVDSLWFCSISVFFLAQILHAVDKQSYTWALIHTVKYVSQLKRLGRGFPLSCQSIRGCWVIKVHMSKSEKEKVKDRHLQEKWSPVWLGHVKGTERER